jgi:hypothetical protein
MCKNENTNMANTEKRVSMPINKYRVLMRRETQILRLKNYVKETWRILKQIETTTEEAKLIDKNAQQGK